jgi:hypothetical protein
MLGRPGKFGQFDCDSTAVMEPMSLESFKYGTRWSMGASKQIYVCASIFEKHQWRPVVKQVLSDNGQAILQRYRKYGGDEMVVIDAIEPNFNINPPSHEYAIDNLALIYYHVFVQFARTYPKAGPNYKKWSELRLFPLCFGSIAGKHGTRHAEITALAIEKAAGMLNDPDFNALVSAQITLCIAPGKDGRRGPYIHYWQAFKSDVRHMQFTPLEGMGANYPPGHIVDTKNPWDDMGNDDADPMEEEEALADEPFERLGIAPHPEFVEVDVAARISAEKEAAKVLSALKKKKTYAALPGPALYRAEHDWGNGDFNMPQELNPDIDEDPLAYDEDNEDLPFRALRHHDWAKVWASMPRSDLPETAEYNLWETRENILPAWSSWLGPKGEDPFIAKAVAAEKKRALDPDDCNHQKTTLYERPWNAPYPDEGRRGVPDDWNHEANFDCMGPKTINRFNSSVTNFQADWTHKRVLTILVSFLEMRQDDKGVSLDKKLVSPLDTKI